MIVPLAAGSAVDVAARLLAQKMGANMGQQIVVENIVGAAGVIGAQQVARAAPDGYTIGGFNDSVLTMVPHLNPQTPFDPAVDFAHVSRVATIEFSIAVAASSPWKSAVDLVAAAKAAPGKYTYASGGNGSPQHMGGALFAAHTGIDIKHVPYRGAIQAAQDVAGNQVDVTMQGIATVAALAKGGKLRLIGVMTDQRHPEYPDAPTLKEVGIQGFEYSTWFGMTAPKGTPKEIVERLQREVVKALADPEIQQRYAALGLKPNGTSPDAMLANVREQLTRYGKAIKDNRITAD
ncbi:MAG: tripartite tricarboxylate transporter substrate binding protein [Rubrivivax sp.]|nr:tripartite tricarboxylate transporter substrate binding protein [Rubrivivax sp.]